jgi:hypothetical protein
MVFYHMKFMNAEAFLETNCPIQFLDFLLKAEA